MASEFFGDLDQKRLKNSERNTISIKYPLFQVFQPEFFKNVDDVRILEEFLRNSLGILGEILRNS